MRSVVNAYMSRNLLDAISVVAHCEKPHFPLVLLHKDLHSYYSLTQAKRTRKWKWKKRESWWEKFLWIAGKSHSMAQGQKIQSTKENGLVAGSSSSATHQHLSYQSARLIRNWIRVNIQSHLCIGRLKVDLFGTSILCTFYFERSLKLELT